MLSLLPAQPLIGNYGVPGYDRDAYGLLKYMESSQIQGGLAFPPCPIVKDILLQALLPLPPPSS